MLNTSFSPWPCFTEEEANAELGETSLMLLVHPTLTDAEIDKTCAVLTQVMTEATY